MEELTPIFKPEDRKIVTIKDVEELKVALSKIQINTSLFTTIIDSIEKKGDICKINQIEEEVEMVFDFKRI